jgi:hypothetical protein
MYSIPKTMLSGLLMTINVTKLGMRICRMKALNKRRCVFNVMVPPAAKPAVQNEIRYAGQSGKKCQISTAFRMPQVPAITRTDAP